MLTSLPAGAAGYISNSDRFHSDTVGDEYSARQDARAKQLKIQEFKRNMVSFILSLLQKIDGNNILHLELKAR